MKTFLKVDYYLQIIVFFGYIIFGFVYGLIKSDLFSVWWMFYFVVGGFQLISYLTKLMMGFWNDLFMKIYGVLILPVWFALLLYQINLHLDFIVVFGALASPFLAFFYLFYCRDKSKNPEAEL